MLFSLRFLPARPRSNLGQLCHALGAGGATAGLTALASCANCLGRIVGGQASERTLYGFSLAEFYSSVRARNLRAARLARALLPAGSSAAAAARAARVVSSAAAATAAATAAGGGVPRSAWLLANAGLEAAGCVIIALSAGPMGLFAGVPLVAAAFGAQNTLLVSVFHERFGHKCVPKHVRERTRVSYENSAFFTDALFIPFFFAQNAGISER